VLDAEIGACRSTSADGHRDSPPRILLRLLTRPHVVGQDGTCTGACALGEGSAIVEIAYNMVRSRGYGAVTVRGCQRECGGPRAVDVQEGPSDMCAALEVGK
jgi:hypothetical protein